MPAFSHNRYNELVRETVARVFELSEKKGGEYSGDEDRLANFRRNAADQELPMESIWRVYAAKHWDAIGQYVKDLQKGRTRERMESLSERADDLIVYLILFKAMVEEHDLPPAKEQLYAGPAVDLEMIARALDKMGDTVLWRERDNDKAAVWYDLRDRVKVAHRASVETELNADAQAP